MKSNFRNANYYYIALSLFIALFGFVLRAYRWKYALNFMGYHPAFANKLMAVCISYFVNMTIPRSGEISRAVVLHKYEDVPFDKGFGTIIAERIIDLLLFLIFVILALVFQFRELSNFVDKHIPIPMLLTGIAGALVFLILLGLLWFYSKFKLILSLKQKIAGLTEGVLAIWRTPYRLPFLYYSVLIWLTYLLMFYVAIFALPETGTIGFGAVMMAFIFGSLAIGFTNSGFGAYPVLVAEVLLIYGVSEPSGNALGWLAWVSQTLLTAALGALSFVLLPIVNRKKIAARH